MSDQNIDDLFAPDVYSECEKRNSDYLNFCNGKINDKETGITIQYYLPEQVIQDDFDEVAQDDNNMEHNIFLARLNVNANEN